MQDSSLLEMSGISKSFPGVKALKDVNFSLSTSQVHILLGENGAGKSTLIKILAGMYQADEGQISISGNSVVIPDAKAGKDLGVSVIYQELNLVPDLSVAKNIYLGREPIANNMIGKIDWDKVVEGAKSILNLLDVPIDVNADVGSLSVADQQMVEIARALSFECKILVMDEPTSSLSDHEIEQLFKAVHRLKEQGVGIIYISHRLEEVHEIGDLVTVLRDGDYMGTWDVSETDLDFLINQMVGRTLTEKFPWTPREHGDVALKVEGLTRNGIFEDINFELNEGEIVGFSGLVGAGRTEVARAIMGADLIDSGSVEIVAATKQKEEAEKLPHYPIWKAILDVLVFALALPVFTVIFQGIYDPFTLNMNTPPALFSAKWFYEWILGGPLYMIPNGPTPYIIASCIGIVRQIIIWIMRRAYNFSTMWTDIAVWYSFTLFAMVLANLVTQNFSTEWAMIWAGGLMVVVRFSLLFNYERVWTPAVAIRRGLGLLPEDRKTQGLTQILSVAFNTTSANLQRLLKKLFLSLTLEKELVDSHIKDLRIATPSQDTLLQFLSGGNQQKVVLAKWLFREANVLIFDEPTRGIDIGAKFEVHSQILELAKEGKAILMISSELPEIIGMSDRVLVMREGKISADLSRENLSQETILRHAMVGTET